MAKEFKKSNCISDQKYEEMVKLVLEIADYAIKTGESTRQIAKKFSVSNYTVSVYLRKRLPNIDPNRYKLVKQIIDKNTPQTIDKVEVRKRIYAATSLLLQGMTVAQIVEWMNQERVEEKVTFDIIYDDLTRRLPLIESDSTIIEDVKRRLTENRLNNLNNQGINGPNVLSQSQPRIQGRFASLEQIEQHHKSK